MKHWAPYHCKSSSGRWTEKCNRYQNEAPALGRNWTGWCFGCFHSQTPISIWSQGVFDCCPEDGPSKLSVPKSVSLHGDHGQESFVDVPGRQFWGREQTTLGHERVRQALSHLMPMNRKQGGLSVPPCSEMRPGLGQVPGEAYWGTAPGSQDSLDGGRSRSSCCRRLLLEERTNDSLRQ